MFACMRIPILKYCVLRSNLFTSVPLQVVCLFAFLCCSLLIPHEADAQNRLMLKRGNNPFPAQSEIRVFNKRFSGNESHTVEPNAFPRAGGISDVITGNGWTANSYETTQESGNHYLVYVLTPDNDLYISISVTSYPNNPGFVATTPSNTEIFTRSLEEIEGVDANLFNNVLQTVFRKGPADFASLADPSLSMRAEEFLNQQGSSSVNVARLSGEETNHLRLVLSNNTPMDDDTDVRVIRRVGDRKGTSNVLVTQLAVPQGIRDGVSEDGFTSGSYPVTTEVNRLQYLVFARDPADVVYVSARSNSNTAVYDQLLEGVMVMRPLGDIRGMNDGVRNDVRRIQFGLGSVFSGSSSSQAIGPPEVNIPPTRGNPINNRRNAQSTPPINTPPRSPGMNLTLIGPEGPLQAGTQVYVYTNNQDRVGTIPVAVEELPQRSGTHDELAAGGVTERSYAPTTDDNPIHYLIYAIDPSGSVYVTYKDGNAIYDAVRTGRMNMQPFLDTGAAFPGFIVNIISGIIDKIPLQPVFAENDSLFPPGTELKLLELSTQDRYLVSGELPSRDGKLDSLRTRFYTDEIVIGGETASTYPLTMVSQKTYLVYAMIPGEDILYVSTNENQTAPVFDPVQTGRVLMYPVNRINGYGADLPGYTTANGESITEVKAALFRSTPVDAEVFYYAFMALALVGCFGGYMVWSMRKKSQRGGKVTEPKRNRRNTGLEKRLGERRQIEPRKEKKPGSSIRKPNRKPWFVESIQNTFQGMRPQLPGPGSLAFPRLRQQNGLPKPESLPKPAGIQEEIPIPESPQVNEDINALKWKLAESKSNQAELKQLLKKALVKIQKLKYERDAFHDALERGLSLSEALQEAVVETHTNGHHETKEPPKTEEPRENGASVDHGDDQQVEKQAEPQKTETETTSATPEEVQLSKAFREWCSSDNEKLSEKEAFEEYLKNEDEQFAVHAVFKDGASSVVPAEFFDTDQGLDAPVLYWRVKIGNRQFLLPMPLNADAFRDPSGIFSGEVTPGKMIGILPARLIDSKSLSADYVLAAAGSLY